jgi:hypothetical protein
MRQPSNAELEDTISSPGKIPLNAPILVGEGWKFPIEGLIARAQKRATASEAWATASEAWATASEAWATASEAWATVTEAWASTATVVRAPFGF